MKLAWWVILVLLLIAPLVLAVNYAHEYLAVDSALDAGASYDYQAGTADFAQNHPAIPFSSRHSTLVTASICSFVAAIVYSFALYFGEIKNVPSSIKFGVGVLAVVSAIKMD